MTRHTKTVFFYNPIIQERIFNHPSPNNLLQFNEYAMRLVTTLPLLGRNPSIRTPLLPLTVPLTLTRSASRLGGINSGLRRSERARPQGASPKIDVRQDLADQPYLNPAERRRARSEARRNRPTFKIRKGKKDITEDGGPPRMSRAARFAHPEDELGQGSLLKKFRTGQLLKELELSGDKKNESLQPDDFARQMLAADVKDFMGSTKVIRSGKGRKRSWESEGEAGRRAAREARAETSAGGGRDTGLPLGEDRSATNNRSWYDREASRDDRKFDRSGGRGHDREPTRGGDRFDQGVRAREPARRENSFGSNPRDRATPREEVQTDRSGRRQFDRDPPRGGNRFDRERQDSPDAEQPREGGRFNRSDRGGLDKGHGGGEFSRPGRSQRDQDGLRASVGRDARADRTLRTGRSQLEQEEEPEDDDADANEVDEDEGDAKERRRKRYEPPASIPYTTAASQFLYGTSTVQAALEASRRQLYRLYLYQGKNRRSGEKDEYLTELAWKRGVKVEYVDESGLAILHKMSQNRPHNGYVLEASPLPQLPVKALGEVSTDNSLPGFRIAMGHQSAEEAKVNGTNEFIITEVGPHKPFVLLLDQILDPGNLGAILRTAGFMGVTAVAVSKRGSTAVTPVVLKASAGAAENMTMFSVDSPVDFVRESRQNGWQVYAACPPKPEADRKQMDVRDVENSDPLLRQPTILVLGNEGEGLSRQLRRTADLEVSIPNLSGSKSVDSLNVSVAAGLLCSSFVRGKTQAARSGVADAKALF